MMMENHRPLTSLDGDRKTPERCPRYSQDHTEENHSVPQEGQDKNLTNIKVEDIKEEEETYVWGDHQSKEEESGISTDGSRNRNTPERYLRTRYSKDNTRGSHRVPHEDQDEAFTIFKVEVIKEEEEPSVRGDQLCKQDEIPTDIRTDISSERQFWSGFIELYRKNECLWKVKSADYANRAKRNRAYDQLIRYSRSRNSAADLSCVKKKIANFRTVFMKEHKKMVESQRSGAGADEVYKPTLWYYDLFKFTLEKGLRTRSRGTLDPESPILFEEEAQESQDLDLIPEVEVEPSTSEAAEVVDRVDSPSPQPSPLKKQVESRMATSAPSSSHNFFQRAKPVGHRTPDVDQTFADYIAAEMRLMTEDQKRIHKRLVLDITSRAIDRTLVYDCEVIPPAKHHFPNVLPTTFPHHPTAQYVPGNPPPQASFFPSAPTQASPSSQSSTSSSGHYSDRMSTQASVLDDPRYSN